MTPYRLSPYGGLGKPAQKRTLNPGPIGFFAAAQPECHDHLPPRAKSHHW